jgi:hypothetical protein
VTLKLVPIPPDYLEGSRAYWARFVFAIAERGRLDPLEMERLLFSGEAQAFLVWDAEIKKAQAFLGVRYTRRADGRIAELIWLTGENRRAWLHLFAELETYLRAHQGCIGIKSIARPGWSKLLKENGYRLTHQVMEKDF